jgi:hypothetical protein
MKAAAVAFLAAALFTGAIALGTLRLGSSAPPPPAIVLPAGAQRNLPVPPADRRAIGQRVEQAPLSAFAERRPPGNRR